MLRAEMKVGPKPWRRVRTSSTVLAAGPILDGTHLLCLIDSALPTLERIFRYEKAGGGQRRRLTALGRPCDYNRIGR